MFYLAVCLFLVWWTDKRIKVIVMLKYGSVESRQHLA